MPTKNFAAVISKVADIKNYTNTPITWKWPNFDTAFNVSHNLVLIICKLKGVLPRI